MKIIRTHVISGLLIFIGVPLFGQDILTLEQCRSLALQNNKQLHVSRMKKEVSVNTRKATRTKYLPKIDAIGSYQYFSKETSLLNREQKAALSNLGTHLGTNVAQTIATLTQQGAISPEMAQQLSGFLSTIGQPLAQAGDKIGSQLVDALRTDTRNIWAGSVMVQQPLYMGGAIIAANRLADINEKMSDHYIELSRQAILYDIEKAYWLVVSLRQKQKLAESYHGLVKKLDEDVYKMIAEGIGTRADGLRVDVKVNEAEMQLTQIGNGLSLAKMLLLQLCGMPLDREIILADEETTNLTLPPRPTEKTDKTYPLEWRPEINIMQNVVDMSKEKVKLERAPYLPQVVLTGGYMISNPNLFNGFERKFSGMWNVGLIARIPLWHWMEGKHKINAAKATSQIAEMELSDAKEKIELQISQERFKVNEAMKRLSLAEKNINSAEENLRCADIGFKEGVMEVTDVMAAQTAWQQALSQKIDAEIDVKLSQVALEKALGILQ